MIVIHLDSPVSALAKFDTLFCDVVVVVAVDMKCGGSSGTDDGCLAKRSPKSPLGTKLSSMIETGSVPVGSSICKRPVGLNVSVCTSAMVRDNLPRDTSRDASLIIDDINTIHHVVASGRGYLSGRRVRSLAACLRLSSV